MKLITTTEGKALLLLYKDFASDYNANTLAAKLGITRRGALNVVKTLHQEELVISRRYGRAIFYKANLANPYGCDMVKMLLMTETQQQAQRWRHQFEKLFPITEAVIIFGSAVRDYAKARDIDLLVVVQEKHLTAAQQIVQKENKVSLKPIHVVWQSPKDFKNNIQKPDSVLLNAIKFGYVLRGYEVIIQTILQVQQGYGYFAIPKPESR
ncbi:nucleotidyltransferase domain-containing protein [Candidatus Woesearchaeota archaeon]|nr:nucleotidyltransferase domain-containing protein [Candidatus Woesearchaeota archaeon]